MQYVNQTAELYGVDVSGNWRLNAVYRIGILLCDGGVTRKRAVSQTHNELKTPGYALLHLRTGYEGTRFGIEAGVENALNRLYFDPLGGAYTGQGRTMSKNGIPWVVAVPGPGRTFYLSLKYKLN